MYQDLVHKYLLDKKWFKKVDALECFSNYQEFGRGAKYMPKHNIFVPGPSIMPRPKFRDYDKEDFIGEDFTYRTRDIHTPSPLETPNTLKPKPFAP